MKKILLSLLLILLAAAPARAAEKKESVFDRVTKSGKIRCGYTLVAPVLYKDPETGAMKGFTYDLVEELGRRLDLKIEWAEETGWDKIVEGLHKGSYDMICVGIAFTSARAKLIDFSTPVFYLPAYVAARANDRRFDRDYAILDDPKYTIAVREGDISRVFAAQRFPRATVSALPRAGDSSLPLQAVETKKADATLVEPLAFFNYDEGNPGKLKIVDRARPVNIMASGWGLPTGDIAFKHMIDTALNEMQNDGTVASTIAAYESRPGVILLPAKPYEAAR